MVAVAQERPCWASAAAFHRKGLAQNTSMFITRPSLLTLSGRPKVFPAEYFFATHPTGVAS